LLNLKLPKLDGLLVLKSLRADERTKRLPVVLFTSCCEQEYMIKVYDRGVNGFVRKPIDFGQFADATRQLGLYWLLLNQPAPE
jgi:DNA-binding response OmpR family regulator